MHAVEVALREQGALPMRFGPTAQHPAEPARLNENLAMVHAELDALAPSRLARLLRALGVPDTTVPLVTATPALRRSWFLAVLVAVLFALSAASNDGSVGVDRIAVFLTLAPLVPLAGVALAFGRGVDPTHELMVAAPRDTFRVFLIRAVTVLAASTLVLLGASLLLPVGGAFRFAWLLPSAAVTTVAMAGSARYEPRKVAAAIAGGWIVLVLVVTQAASAQAMFGPVLQVGALLLAIIASVSLWRSRRSLEFGTSAGATP